jgi:hypothetical protein
MNRTNVIAGVICFGIGAFVYWLAGSVPAFTATDNLGGRFFPRLVSVMLMLASVGLIVTGWFNMEISGGTAPRAGEPGGDGAAEPDVLPIAQASAGDDSRRFGPGEMRLVGFVLVMTVYTLILPLIGYIAASVVTFAALIAIAGERRPLHVAAGAIGITALLYILFAVIFNMNVPQASLF